MSSSGLMAVTLSRIWSTSDCEPSGHCPSLRNLAEAIGGTLGTASRTMPRRWGLSQIH